MKNFGLIPSKSRLLSKWVHSNQQMINKINNPAKHVKSKYKIAVVGPYACGKTSLLAKFAHSTFSEDYHMTLKPFTYQKTIQLENCLFVRLEMIDTLGSGLPLHNYHSSFRDIDAVLLVYDVTSEQSFFKLSDILTEMKTFVSPQALYALIGTHCDQPHLRQVTFQEGMKFKKRNGISLFNEISAKTNENVTDFFYDLTKYLIIINSYKEKQENPEVSTTFEDERVGGKISKTTLIEKKLAYKEDECNKLWKDYEQALDRICYFQSKVKDQSSYILNYVGDSDELQQKVQELQNDLERMEETYRQKYQQMEEESLININNLTLRVGDYRHQNGKLKVELEKLSNELMMIGIIVQEQEENSKNLLDRKGEQIQRISEEKLILIEANRLLSQLIQKQVQERLRIKHQSQEIQKKLRQEISQLERSTIQMKAQIDCLFFLKQEANGLILNYEKSLTYYRQQKRQKEYLEEQLSLQQQKCCRLQLTYQETIQHLKNQYQAIIQNMRKEKEALLQAKEKVVNKFIESKVNEIKHIRSFIDDIQSKKQSNNPKKMQQNSKIDQQAISETKIKEFFEKFLESVKENSQFMHYNLETIAQTYDEIEESFTSLFQDVEKLDLSEVWYDLKEGENLGLASFASKAENRELWHIFNIQAQKRISKCMGSIEQISAKVKGNNQDLKQNIGYITDSLAKIEKISEVGIEQYLQISPSS